MNSVQLSAATVFLVFPLITVIADATGRSNNASQDSADLQVVVWPQEGIHHPPVDLLLTAPDQKRLGRDPISGRDFKEIPKAAYETTRLSDDVTGDEGADNHEIEAIGLQPGTYHLVITGVQRGSYSASVVITEIDGSRSANLSKIPISAGARHQMVVEITNQSAPESFVYGAFPGTSEGESPTANTLLSYLTPPGGCDGKSDGILLLFYSSFIAPSTFRAELNGRDISALFSPGKGKSQAITPPWQKGKNLLRLSVQGHQAGQTMIDTDEVLFQFP